MRTRLADFAAEAETLGAVSTHQGGQIDDGERGKEGTSQEDNDVEALNPSAATELDLEENDECGASGEVDRGLDSNATVSGDEVDREGGDHGHVDETDSGQEEACEARQDAEEVVDST